MNQRTISRRSTINLTLLLTGILFPATSHAITTWDLQASWSNASDPPGTGLGTAWSYRNLSGGLFNLLQTNISNPIWSGVTQPAFSLSRWTDSATPDNAPGLSTTNGNNCQETAPSTGPCAGRPGVNWLAPRIGGVAYDIRWTAPYDTTITVSADVWKMRNQTLSQQALDIKLNGVDQGRVDIPNASRYDGFGATSPLTLAAAYGPGFLQGVTITAGTTLDFIVGPSNADQINPDFVGIDFRIDGTDQFTNGGAPEPATVGLMLSGLAALVLKARRKKA